MTTQNPRVAAYLPLKISESLVEFRRERGFKSDSAAIVAVLEAYFFGNTPNQALSEPPSTAKRLEELEGKWPACLRL